MTPADIGTWIATAVAAALAVFEAARRILAALKDLRADLKADIKENTEETKNGHAIKEQLLKDVVFWRNEAMREQIKGRRADALEEAMRLSPEGRAFLAILEKNYGWRVAGQEGKKPD